MCSYCVHILIHGGAEQNESRLRKEILIQCQEMSSDRGPAQQQFLHAIKTRIARRRFELSDNRSPLQSILLSTGFDTAILAQVQR